MHIKTEGDEAAFKKQKEGDEMANPTNPHQGTGNGGVSGGFKLLDLNQVSNLLIKDMQKVALTAKNTTSNMVRRQAIYPQPGIEYIVSGASMMTTGMGDLAKAGYRLTNRTVQISDVQQGLQGLNETLDQCGLRARLSTNPPPVGGKLCSELQKVQREVYHLKLKGALSQTQLRQINDALKNAQQLGIRTKGAKIGRYRFRGTTGFRGNYKLLKNMRFSLKHMLIRPMRHNDPSNTLLAWHITTKMIKTTKKAYRAARVATYLPRLATVKAAYFIAAQTLRKAKQLAASNNAAVRSAATMTLKAGHGFRTVQKKLPTKKNRTQWKQDLKHKAVKRKNKFKSKIKAKFKKTSLYRSLNPVYMKLRAMRTKIAKKLSNTAVARTARFFSRTFSRIANAIATIIQAIATAFSYVFLILGLVIILVFIVAAVIQGIAGLFDFGSSEEEIQEAAIEQVVTCYHDDLEYIAGLANSDQYDTVEVRYEHVRNDAVYAEHIEGDNFVLTQTTNTAEILSMALVRFEYDFEDAGKSAVLQYVQELYNGSHEIVISSAPDSRTAIVTYRTYYFDYMFDRTLNTSRNIISSSSSLGAGMVENVTDIYVYFRDQGFSHAGALGIMANIKRECNFNETSGSRSGGYGLFQWTAGRYDNLKAYCESQQLDYTSKEGQLAFFLSELNTSGYADLLQYLKTATDPKSAGMEFQAIFERNVWSNPAYTHATYQDQGVGVLRQNLVGTEYTHLDKTLNYASAYDRQYQAYKDDYSAIAGTVGDKVAREATRYVGQLHYRYGGTSLTNGADCSGFVYALYAQIGISIPRGSVSLRADSSHAVAYRDMKPGDIVVVHGGGADGNHVGIYIGNGQFVNSSTNACGSTSANFHGPCPNDCIISTWTRSDIKKCSDDDSKLAILRYW